MCLLFVKVLGIVSWNWVPMEICFLRFLSQMKWKLHPSAGSHCLWRFVSSLWSSQSISCNQIWPLNKINPFLKLIYIYTFIFSSSVLLLCVHTLYNPFAHPSCTSLLFILLIIKSQYTGFAHLIWFALFILLHILLFISLFFYLYICSCVVLLLYNFYFYYFALSTERIWFDLHFTSDYTLYNLLCDE